ncbi:MAG: hypothetical protein ACKVRP_08160 [Bacteroidota bacterium]
MKKLLMMLPVLGMFGVCQEVMGQPRPKAIEELERLVPLPQTSSIQDRAGGLHNKSNIGEFFENRGKLYARTLSQGPSGEFPIGSGKEYIYRINPMVGLPNNVIQGRYTTNEEWEAAEGYHNRDSARIAFSDKPYTWPATGWPVKDASGNPLFISDQDSYCVYNDSNNTRPMRNLQVNQTGYAFSLRLVEDMIFFTYDIINKSTEEYDSLYFSMYVDMDIGNYSGGVPEYGDDKVGFNRELQLSFFHDDGLSSEWPGGTTGYFGVAMLKTPLINGVMQGVTDFHYNQYDDDLDTDSVQYGIMSSAASLYASPLGPRYFHPGINAPDIHFDDPATIPVSGLDILANMATGPYTIAPGETLTFVTVMVAGDTRNDIFTNTQRAFDLLAAGYSRPQPPDPPELSVVPGDRKVTITWDNRSENSRDVLTGLYDFEGYRLYKSVDRGQHWDQIDRNQFPNTGPDPIPLAKYDKINGIGEDLGLQYSYIDTAVVNGFEYWYSITSYDQGDSLVASLESARGNNTESMNLGIAIPRSSAVGRTPVGVSAVTQSGSGSSNVVISIRPNDVAEAGDKTYELRFLPVVSVEKGNLRTSVQVTVDSTTPNTAHTFGLTFLSPTTYRVRDLTKSTILVASGTYTSGTPIAVEGLLVVLADTSATPDHQPEAGDSLLIRIGMNIVAGGVEVMPLRPVIVGTTNTTTNGVMISLAPADPIQGIMQTAGNNALTVIASVTAVSSIIDQTYKLNVVSAFTDSGGSINYLMVELRNSADSLIAGRDSLRSGNTIAGQGFTLTASFSPTVVPTAGTVVEIITVKRRLLTYQDAFTFATTGARVDDRRVASELDRIKVVPNPYLISSRFEQEFGTTRREPIRVLKFNNLPPRCTIHIFTLDGDRVQTIEHDRDNGTEDWNMRGSGGREIAPGVYIYLVKTDTAEKIGRFAVIK